MFGIYSHKTVVIKLGLLLITEADLNLLFYGSGLFKINLKKKEVEEPSYNSSSNTVFKLN